MKARWQMDEENASKRMLEFRIAELEVQISVLRKQRDGEIAGRLFAEELLARGAKPPRTFRSDGWEPT